jgi:hypothetical protein
MPFFEAEIADMFGLGQAEVVRLVVVSQGRFTNPSPE